MAPPSTTATIEDDDDELTQEIQDQVNEWSSNSNDCFTIQLVRGDGNVATSFKPELTNAIFGEEEAIFGYQGLSITLSFAAHDLKPELKIKYNNIFEAQGDVRPTDIKEALKEFLPRSAFEPAVDPAQDGADFDPPGERIHEYIRNEKTYEIWCASLADPAARQIVTNMQILMPMFIDGGSMLELDFVWTTRRWRVFFVYEVDNSATAPVSKYTLAGYSTSYRMFTFPDRQQTTSHDYFAQSLQAMLPAPTAKPNEFSLPSDIHSPAQLPSRERLSQFLLLPPFQRSGHGQELYGTMYKHLTSAANVQEFTVEDPNEQFDNLRDFCDLRHLRAHVPAFAALRINPDVPAAQLGADAAIPTDAIVPGAARAQIQRETKIMPRQFDRLVEMHTLSFIPPAHRSRTRTTRREKASSPHDRAYYLWRLYVKQRLYVFNRDLLAQVEHAERVEKLEAALDGVQEAYVQMIERVEEAEQAAAAAAAAEEDVAAGEQTVAPGSAARKKRKIVVDDEDNDGNEDGDGAGGTAEVVTNGHSKKVRVE